MEKKEDIEKRIYNVSRYIEQNLDKNLTLDELASIAHFSSFHFQRVFKESTGETPKQYISRLRLEEAAHRIVLYPENSMIDVALSVGFQSLESFSRAFKNYYKISPSFFRNLNDSEKLEVIQNPELDKNFLNASFLASHIDESQFESVIIEVKKLPPKKAVYIETTLEDPELITRLFKKIRNWTQAHELAGRKAQMFGVIKDYPLFTPLNKCRYLVCIEVDKEYASSGSVQYMEIPSKTYATFRAHGDVSNVMENMAYFAHYWLPESGYKITHGFAMEVPINDPVETNFAENYYQLYVQVIPA